MCMRKSSLYAITSIVNGYLLRVQRKFLLLLIFPQMVTKNISCNELTKNVDIMYILRVF